MNKYVVKIPAYEIEIEARDDLDAYNQAVNMICFEDADISKKEEY